MDKEGTQADDFLREILARCEETPAPVGEDFIESSVRKHEEREAAAELVEKFREARKAAGRLNNLVQKASESSYKGIFVNGRPVGTGYLVGGFGMIGLSAVATVFFPPLILAMAPAAIAGCVGGYKLYDKKPVAQLSWQNTLDDGLPARVKRLPDCPEKIMLRDFSDAAKGYFLLGYASALREQTFDSKASYWRKKGMERNIKGGLDLISDAAKIMKYKDVDGKELAKQFVLDGFPTAKEFADKLDARYQDVKQAVTAKLRALEVSL